MDKLVIKHTGDPADVEATLEKAVKSIQLNREENKKFPENFLEKKKVFADQCRNLIIEAMINDIANTLSEGD